VGATRRAAVTSRVFIRVTAEQPKWQLFPPTVQTGDAKIGIDVAALVHQRPNFLNLAEVETSPFRVALPLSEIVGVRSPVLVAVQESGGLFVVGCPDESGPDAYTTLVADILAASTRLWRMSYEQFSALFARSEGAALEELMLERSSADWDFDQFQPAVSASLERGRFPILIVTAEPGGEVRQVLDYLNGMNLTAAPVSYSVWSSGGIVVIEPVPAAGVAAPGPVKAAVTSPPGFTPVTEVTLGSVTEPPPVQTPVETPPAERPVEPPATRIGAGAVPTEPAKNVAKPPSPGTKPGVMSGKRPPPKPKNSSGGK
jgi:hypothetical protein